MFPKILELLVLIFVFTVGYAILRRLMDLLIEHKVRLRVLEEMDRTAGQQPVREETVNEVIMQVNQAVPRAKRQDYRITGLLLGIFGILSAMGGRALGTGTLAVGLFTAGEILVGLGFGIALSAMGLHAYRERRLH